MYCGLCVSFLCFPCYVVFYCVVCEHCFTRLFSFDCFIENKRKQEEETQDKTQIFIDNTKRERICSCSFYFVLVSCFFWLFCSLTVVMIFACFVFIVLYARLNSNEHVFNVLSNCVYWFIVSCTIFSSFAVLLFYCAVLYCFCCGSFYVLLGFL